jgi:hypothetical protein
VALLLVGNLVRDVRPAALVADGGQAHGGFDASGNRLTYTVNSTTFTNQVSPTSNRLSGMQRVSLTTVSVVTDTPVYDAASNTTSGVYSYCGRLATSQRADPHRQQRGRLPLQRAGAAWGLRSSGTESRVKRPI